MAPKPRIIKAFRAMKELGINEDIVKPVLKGLLKLYNGEWDLIEEENYRTLADAIFEYEDSKAADQKKPNDDIQTEVDDLGEGTQVHDEPERPLKRLRLRHQEQPVSSSPNESNVVLAGAPLKVPKVEADEHPETSSQKVPVPMPRAPVAVLPSTQLRSRGNQPASLKPVSLHERSEPSQQQGIIRGMDNETRDSLLSPRDKGKAPMSPKIPSKDLRSYPRSPSQTIRLREPHVEPGISLVPKVKVPNTFALIKPKDEPVTDDVSEFGVPLAITFPDAMPPTDSADRNTFAERPVSQYVNGKSKGDGASAATTEKNNYDLANMPGKSTPTIEIASSPLGEVKVSLSLEQASRPDFHMPSLDAVLKDVEDRCLRTYKISDPNFSVRNLMKDMCESFLALGTDATDKDKLLDPLHIKDAKNDKGYNTIPTLEAPISVEVVAPEVLKLPCFFNGLTNHIVYDENVRENVCENEKEKETVDLDCENSLALVSLETQNVRVNVYESETEKETMDLDYEKSLALVAVETQLGHDDARSVYNVLDVTKGEEQVAISLVNEMNDVFPPAFHYIPQNLVFQKASVSFSLAKIGDCDCCSMCFGDCLSSEMPCACAHETGGAYAYTLNGLLTEDFLEECISMKYLPRKDSHYYCEECPLQKLKCCKMPDSCNGHLIKKFIKECWSKCGCSKQCGNRLVQRGITYHLQVFMTAEGKGWGLRTLEDIPKGAFICEYNGEILTVEELYDRSIKSSGHPIYPVLLDASWGSGNQLSDEQVLCLDAASYGNVGRFINHRCLDANLVEIPVVMESPNHGYYHLAFFATRKIDAMEELTWDYGVNFDDHGLPIKAFRCACGSRFCRSLQQSNSKL